MTRTGNLGRPGFRRLVIAWSFSNFGDSARYLTLAIWSDALALLRALSSQFRTVTRE